MEPGTQAEIPLEDGLILEDKPEAGVENDVVVQPPTESNTQIKENSSIHSTSSRSSNSFPVSPRALKDSVREVVKQLEKRGLEKTGSKLVRKRSSDTGERRRSLSRTESRNRSRSRGRNRIPVTVNSKYYPKAGGGGNNRSRSRSGDLSPAKSHHHVAVVEVHQRKEPLGIKTQKGKYASPYQCKVFPVKNAPRGTIPPFAVDPLTYRLLDNEYFHTLQKEKYDLMEAVQKYYKECEKAHQEATLFSEDVQDTKVPTEDDLEESLISVRPPKETFMSWIMKEKNKDIEREGIEYWNPMSNIFRKAVSTQVSGQASCLDRNQMDPTTLPDHKIHLIGNVDEEKVRKSALSMYQSLKILQKVIHISDVLCFRDNLPEEMLTEQGYMAFYQPEFQKFMESANEIEILENLISFLGSSKENIQNYLSSLKEANLIPGKDSGLKKMKSPTTTTLNNNNNVEANEDETKPSTSQILGLNENKEAPAAVEPDPENKIEGDGEKTLEINQIIPLTCPSCHSHIDIEVNAFPRGPRLPRAQTFLEEQRRLTMCTYFSTEVTRKALMQEVMCHGLRYKIQYTTSDPCGPIQGIVKAKSEYLGQPSPLSLDLLLSTIQRCTSYIDTRLACACVWGKQSKKHLLSVIEKYLAKECKPSTSMNGWQISKTEKRLKKYNVFGGIIRDFCTELGQAICMIHFCLQKSLRLLDKKLRDPVLPGFRSWQGMQIGDSNRWISEDYGDNRPSRKFFIQEQEAVLGTIENLYNRMRNQMSLEDFQDLNEEAEGDDKMEDEEVVSVEVLAKIVAFAVKDIANVCRRGKEYIETVKPPGRNGKRVLRFFAAAADQLGSAKEIELGSLIATFLSAVEKLNLFEELMCEQKVDVRANIHKMCMKIMKKLGDLKGDLWMQKNWTNNLAKNAYLKLKEVNEVKKLKKLKKNKKQIEEIMRTSDESLRLAVH